MSSEIYDDYAMTEGFEMKVKRRIPFTDQHFDRMTHRERKFSSTHTFRPEEVSSLLPGDQERLRLHSSVPFLARVKNWEKNKKKRLKKQINDKEKEKMKKCTFRPVISNLQITNEKRIQSYHRSYQKAKRNFLRQKKINEQKIQKECTFKPDTRKTVRRVTPRKPVTTGKNRRRYSSAVPSRRESKERGYFVDRMSRPRNYKKKEEDPDCTFKPSINRYYFRNRKRSNNRYLEQNAFARLSKGRKRVQTPDIRKTKSKRRSTPARNISNLPKRRSRSAVPNRGRRSSLSIGNLYREKKRLFRESCPDSEISMSKSELIAEQAELEYEQGTVSSRKRNQGNRGYEKTFESTLRGNLHEGSVPSKKESSKEALNRFFRRTAERDALRDKRLRRLKEGYEPNHQPKINTKSRSIVKSGPSFLDRLQVSLASQRSKLREKRRETREQHNFQPKINPKSRELCHKNYKLRVRSNEDRYREYSEAKLKIENIRKQIEKERMKEATFHPKINKKPRPSQRGKEQFFKGTTGMNDPDTYMKRIEEREKRKKWKERKQRKEEIREKMKECTFRPKIKKVPNYVRKIARTYHMSKMRKKKVEKKREGWK